MKETLWDKQKAKTLRENPDRGVTFERCVIAIENDDILADIENPSRDGQNILILNIDNDAYVVPYVEDEKARYLKTIYPSRKYTKLYFK